MASYHIPSPPSLIPSSNAVPQLDRHAESSSSPSSQGVAEIPVTPPRPHDKPQYPQPSEFYPHEHAVKQWPPPDYISTCDDDHNEMGSTESIHQNSRDSDQPQERKWLTPEEDDEARRGIPIFRPTMEEFEDFEAYMEKIDPWGRQAGIVKVIPPKEWSQAIPPISKEALARVVIKSPIEQYMEGRTGIFRQQNMVKKKRMDIKEWFTKCQTKIFKGSGPKDLSVSARREKAAQPSPRNRSSLRTTSTPDVVGERQETELALDSGLKDGEPASSANEGHDPTLAANQDTAAQDTAAQDTAAQAKAEIDPWYETFDPMSSWLPQDTTLDDYSVEACKELERKFWRGLGSGQSSWYGADLQGSLFTDKTTSWNVAHLPNFLTQLLNRLKTFVPGVNTPYLYFGMWAAAFAWHVEDVDLYSINYIHFGAPKFWYAIPPKKAETFERVMAQHFPDSNTCSQFLRHKSYAVSPHNLASDSVRPNVLVQKQGEFVITYPRGYHSGFNMGFNCAESINFAPESWVPIGRLAQVCQCETDNVRIDIDALISRAKDLDEAAAGDGTPHRKRKLTDDGDGTPKLKRVRATPANVSAVPPPIVVRPCIFCPDPDPVNLIPLHEPSQEIQAISKGLLPRSHESCARLIREVDIYQLPNGSPVVVGANDIPKDRWKLKCSSCKDPHLAKMGAKVQCEKGKCVRAYHATCAIRDAEVVYENMEVEEWVVRPPQPGDTRPHYDRRARLLAQILCPKHNPTLLEAKKRQEEEVFRQTILDLPIGEPIVVRFPSGAMEVFLAAIYETEKTLRVVAGDGCQSTVKWTAVILKPRDGSTTASVQNNQFRPDHIFTAQDRAEKYAQRLHSPAGTGHPPAQGWVTERDAVVAFVAAVKASGQEPPLRAYADQVGIDLSHVDLSHVKLTPELISLLMNNPLTRSHIEPERLRHIA